MAADKVTPDAGVETHSSDQEASARDRSVEGRAPSATELTALAARDPAVGDAARAGAMRAAHSTIGTARLSRLMNPPVGDGRSAPGAQPADTLPIGAAEAARALTGGQPIDANVRPRVERAVGADLGGVRVHNGPEANAAAESLSARAFTSGADIFLGPDESATDTRLIAHEAAHAVQSRGDPTVRRHTPSGGDAHEVNARGAEDAVRSQAAPGPDQRSGAPPTSAAIADPPAPPLDDLRPPTQSGSPVERPAGAARAETLAPVDSFPSPRAPAPPRLTGSSSANSVDLRVMAGIGDDDLGAQRREDGAGVVVQQLTDTAALGRREFAERLAAAIDGLGTKVERHDATLARAGEQQRRAITASFGLARRRVGSRFVSARATIARDGGAKHAALAAWQARTTAEVSALFGAKQARVLQIGENAAGRAATAGERAANDARARIRNRAEQARAIGAAKANVGSKDPDAARAKAKAALDLAADTASNVTQGVEHVGAGLTASGPEVAAKFRQQAAQAAIELRSGKPEVIAQVGRIRADAAAAVTRTVSAATASLTAQERHLSAEITRREAHAQATLHSAMLAKQDELRQAAEQGRRTLAHHGARVLQSAGTGARELASHLAAQPIAPERAANVGGQLASGLRSGFTGVGDKADSAVAQVRAALDAGATEAVAAITRIGPAVESDVSGAVTLLESNVGHRQTATTSALEHLSDRAAKAGTDLLAQVGGGLDQSIGKLDAGFGKGLADYERSLRDKVAEKETKAVEPVNTLGARIDAAQARIEDEAGHSWIGNQLRQLGRMLTDPGFWAGLLVGLLLTILVIALLPEELVGLAFVAAVAAFAAVGAIAAGVGTIVSNVAAGRPWSEGLGKAVIVGAVFGAVLGAAGIWLGAAALTVGGILTLSVIAGILTVITNVATGRPWDENLLANMLLVALLARAAKLIPRFEPGGGRRGAPPANDPNVRPPVVDPNHPPDVDPNQPPVVDPNRPPDVDPNQPPAPYDPTTRTIDELRGDLDPARRPGETPDQAAERTRRARIELDHREVLDRLAALPERPPQIDMAANDAANRGNGAHTTTRHSPDFPMERRLDAGGHPDGTQTVEGRLYEDPPWDAEGGQQNKSFHWRSWDLLNETVNRYLRRNWQQIREDLALLGSHDATVDAGKSIGDGFFNRRAGQPGGRANPLPQRINNVSRFTIRIRFNPGGHPPFFILTTFPDPPLFI
jgi:Domain of unknown function (DUF4157)